MTLNDVGIKVNGFLMNYSFVAAVNNMNKLHSIQFFCVRNVYVVPISVKIFFVYLLVLSVVYER
jgi:hypothetical protein